jgi:predicted transcriptional regulator
VGGSQTACARGNGKVALKDMMNRWCSGRVGPLTQQDRAKAETTQTSAPAVPIEDSVTPNFLICLETGTRQILLRRHLRERLRMSPDEYRQKWGLPRDYPMAAASYLQRRDKIVNMHQPKHS